MPQVYNPYEDNDVRLPAFKADGKPLVVPAHIVGVQTKEITNRNNEENQIVDFELEVSSQIEKLGEIDIFEENDSGQYIYNKPKEKRDASIFEGTRIRTFGGATFWRNLSKASGRQNRMFLENLKKIGVEPETEELEYQGKKVKGEKIPDTEEYESLFLGLPVFAFLGIDSFESNDGGLVKLVKANKMVKNENGQKRKVQENSLAKQGSSQSPDDDPFGDDESDDEIPF